MLRVICALFVLTSTAAALARAPASAEQAPPPKRTVILDPAPLLPTLQFDHLTIEDGLSMGQTVAIAQDKQGFMWFGTRDGLQRYDGNKFVYYRPDPERPEGLGDSVITKLLVDDEGYVWVGTWSAGLTRIKPGTSEMVSYRHSAKDEETLGANAIGALLLDSEGVLWVGTLGGGLNRFDRKTGKVKRYINEVDDPESISSDYVIALLEDAAGTLWVGTEDGGLDAFDRKAETFTVYFKDPSVPESLSANTVTSLFEDSAGRLWVGTTGGGLNLFDRQEQTFRHYKHDPKEPTTLSDNNVSVLHEDSAGNFWVGTKDGGLNLMDVKSGTFTAYKYDRSDPRSFGYGDLMSVYEDKEGTLWFGTHVGLSKLDRTRLAFRVYKHSPERRYTLSQSIIYAFFEAKDRRLWLGSLVGLDRVFLDNGKVRNYAFTPEQRQLFQDIRTIWADPDSGYAWVGVPEEGLLRLDMQSGKIQQYKFDPNELEGIGGPSVQVIYPAADGKLWIGLWGRGLDLFDPKTQEFEHFPFDPLESDLPSGFISSIYPSRDGKTLWLGTVHAGEHHGGLAAMDIAEGTFKVYRHDAKDPGSISSDTVLTVYEDSRGILWAGTGGSGLNRLDPDAKAFKRYDTKKGLSNDTVYGILEDEDKHLWISTNRGLNMLEVESEKFTVYTTADGLPRDEFIQGAYHKGEKLLYFGSMDGALVFDPKQVTRNPFVPPVVLTSFSKLNQAVDLGKPLADVPVIDLNYRENVFAFEFAALSFRAPEHNHYAYMLEGFDNEWREARMGRFASYTNPDGGEYVFKVKASNNHGVWNEAGTAIRLRVEPPPWKTWWAYTLYVVSLVSAILLYVLYLRRKHKSEMAQQALQKDLELTGAVQSLFLPKNNTFASEELCVAGYYRPAAHSSGDWWWYEPRADGSLLVLVGDVTGHGAGPAMVTASIASSFRTLEQLAGERNLAPESILEHMHQNMARICQGAFNMTVSMLYVEPGATRFRWWCAGAPPILVRSGQKLDVIPGRGTPLGATGDFDASEKARELKPGEQIIIFTDGVSELTLANGRQLGLNKLRKLVTALGEDELAPAMRDYLSKELEKLLAGRAADDDITFAVIGRLAAGSAAKLAS